MRANEHAVGTITKGGKRNGSGAKRKHFATVEKTAAQVAAADRDNFSTTKTRKEEVVTMLKKQLGPAFKRNSLMKYLDELLARDLQEIADPNLAQKRVLEGTLLEDLSCPRKRAPGKKLDGTRCHTT